MKGDNKMAKLTDLVKVCRSKNCSPFMFHLDLFFKDEETYQKVKAANVFTPELVAETYKLPLKNVYGIFWLDDCLAVKMSAYKKYIVGEPDNRDVLTTQKHVPLLNMEIDID